jgi:hypothetical protein
VTSLTFLSPDRARAGDGFEPALASPLARALAGDTRVRDLSLLGKIEVRGEIDRIEGDADLYRSSGVQVHHTEIVRITPRRVLVLCPYERCAELRARLGGIDMTAAYAGLELEGEQTMRRLTDLDLDALPAAGKVAEVPAVVLRDGDRFRIFFPQELGHYVAEVVLDTLDGLA